MLLAIEQEWTRCTPLPVDHVEEMVSRFPALEGYFRSPRRHSFLWVVELDAAGRRLRSWIRDENGLRSATAEEDRRLRAKDLEHVRTGSEESWSGCVAISFHCYPNGVDLEWDIGLSPRCAWGGKFTVDPANPQHPETGGINRLS